MGTASVGRSTSRSSTPCSASMVTVTPMTRVPPRARSTRRSEEHTSELQSLTNLVCRLLLEKKNNLELLVEVRWQSLRGLTRIPLYHPFLFFFNDTATTEIYTLSLHDALPISELDRLPVSNASVYEGPSAVAAAGYLTKL